MFSLYAPRTVAAAVLTLMLGAGQASAATLFIDNFNRSSSNTVGNGWIESNRSSDDVAIINLGNPHYGVLQLRDYQSSLIDASATKLNIGTTGFVNLSVQFDWKGHETGSGDILYFDWKPTGTASWINLAAIELTSSSWHTTGLLSLGALADNISGVDVRFWTDVTDSYQQCGWSHGKYKCTTKDGDRDQAAKVDNFKIFGETPPDPGPGPDPTPIPGALPLFVSGAAMLGGLVYRRRRQEKAAK